MIEEIRNKLAITKAIIFHINAIKDTNDPNDIVDHFETYKSLIYPRPAQFIGDLIPIKEKVLRAYETISN